MGEALHLLIESARKGRAGDPVDSKQLRELWTQHISDVETRAISNGDESWLPLASTVSFLERTRLWAIKLASNQPVRSGTGPIDGVEPATESWVESQDKLVAGKIDAVSHEDGSLVIQDFKAGEVTDPQGQVKEEYSLQMKLYAALYNDSFGRWPERLELVDRRGDITVVAFDKEEAQLMLEESKRCLVEAQAAVGDGGTLDEGRIAQMADPEAGSCETCRHRPTCPRFIEDLSHQGAIFHGDSSYPSVDLVGSVSDASVGENGRLSMDLRFGSRTWTIQGLSSHGRFRDPEGAELADAPERGEVIGVFGATPRRPIHEDVIDHFVSTPKVRAYRLPNASIEFEDPELEPDVPEASDPEASVSTETAEEQPVIEPEEPAMSSAPAADDLCCKSSCSGNPGPGKWMFQRLLSTTPDRTELLQEGEFRQGTNNQGEFLALATCLRWALENNRTGITLWSSSDTAIRWVGKKKYNRSSDSDDDLAGALAESESWLEGAGITFSLGKTEEGSLTLTVRDSATGRAIVRVSHWSRRILDRSIPG